MAQDTDPGVGVGTPLPGGLPVATTPEQRPTACVSYERSLQVMMIDNKAGAYGFRSPEQCDVWWKAYQREGWIDKLRMSSSELKRDLGAPMCPEAHLDELHKLKQRIKLRQAPVAYLGQHTFTDWTEANLTRDFDTQEASIDLCDSDIAPGTITDVQVSYADDILACYAGLQTLQAPCLSRLEGTCGAGGDDGYHLTWPMYQLVKPELDEAEIVEQDQFIDKVKWRVASVDADLSYELVGECNCSCCSNGDPTFTLTLQDANEGIVCIDCEDSDPCLCSNRYIRINYATQFGDGAAMDPLLEEAIVLHALVKAERTPVKPCGCDNSWVDGMLEMDPTAQTEFARKLTYGPTVAGMKVMRIVDKLLKRPHFNQSVATGGLFSGKKLKNNKRQRSFLRGY